MVGLILLAIVIVAVISVAWTSGIDYMHKKHPDYKGEDFFNEEDKNNVL
jgi:hypothetical protein